MAIALPPAQPAGCKPPPYCCPCNARSRLEKHSHDKGVFKGNFILKSVRLAESNCSCHVWVIASKRALFASADGAGVWPVDGWNCQLGWHAESQPEVRSLLALVSKASPHPVSEQGCMTTTTKPVYCCHLHRTLHPAQVAACPAVDSHSWRQPWLLSLSKKLAWPWLKRMAPH